MWAYLKWGPEAGPRLAVVEDETSPAERSASEEGPAALDRPARPSSQPRKPSVDASARDTWIRKAHDPKPLDGIQAPKQVVYRVQTGGSLRIIANLYKIYHHEIQQLNPGIGLDQELSAGTPVVVYRGSPSSPSESVGTPSRGSVEGSIPMPDGPGRLLKAIPWKRWGTAATVVTVDKVLRQWADRFPDAQPILVGNLSAPQGGRLRPHSTHQSGRDVDLGYPQLPSEDEYNWREMSERNLDVPKTWALLKLLADTAVIEAVLVDQSLQKLLYQYARKELGVAERDLAPWLEYPRSPGSADEALVRHVPGHLDHMHVRVACPPGQTRCRARSD